MARSFQEKVQLAIADPQRAVHYFYYHTRNLVGGITGLGGRPRRLDADLVHALGGAAGAAPSPAPHMDIGERVALQPLLRGERTYNPSHPDYYPALTRNYPGRIFNRRRPCANPAFAAISRMARLSWVPDHRWNDVLAAAALEEASAVPGADQVFERRRFVEDYVARLHQTYGALYQPGWVNLEDALFLYWLVRQARPKTIVQTGVCNGLSAAFMMLALAKNGPDGTLHVIDLPQIFDPGDPQWTVAGEVYGVVIPEGKTSGWLVPDVYRDRFELRTGDARELLPKMVDEVASIDLFYHDSDHSYDHMMFEFDAAKRKLNPGGLVVADDVSWNTSLWDFADRYGVPAYNFKGTIGVAFF